MDNLRVETLILEKNLAKALGVSKDTMNKLRKEGCPYLRIGGRVFYSEPKFMEWVLANKERVSDPSQEPTGAV